MGSVRDFGGEVVRTARLHQIKRGEFEGVFAGAERFSSSFPPESEATGGVAASTESSEDIERVIRAWEIPVI